MSYQSIYRSDLFTGQVVLVTGGGTGLGRCTAHELASLGATVVIAGRREDVLEQTANEILSEGGACDCVPMNIRDEASVEQGIATIIERHSRLDGLFNNAGGQFPAPAEAISANGWRSVIDLNLNGTYLVTQAAFRAFMKDNGGAVVNMLADIWNGYPGMAHMSAARAGIANMAKTLSLEWAQYDIRINCVAPGTILSNGLTTYPDDVQDFTVEQTAFIPSGRLGTESEVSAAVVFLLSPASAYIRGETIRVDGGEGLQKRRLIPVTGNPPTRRFDGFHHKPDLTGSRLGPLDEKTDVNND